MTKSEAYDEMFRLVLNIQQLMPMEWLRENGNGSKTMEALSFVMDMLKDEQQA